MSSFYINGSEALTPVGAVIAYFGSTAPSGWIICDGTYLNRTTYAKLFSVLGTTYGSTDSNNFRIPDLKGMFLRGTGSNSGYEGPSLGVKQDHAIANHNHSVKWYMSPDVKYVDTKYMTISSDGGGAVSNNAIGNAIGTNVSTETRPVNIGVNWIMKY